MHCSKAGGLAATVRLAAQFRNWHLADCHWHSSGHSSRGRRFAIAAPRTSAPRPRGPMVYPRACYPAACYLAACYPAGEATPAAAARNLLQDWRAQDSVAPTLAKFYRRRILGRELASGRSITVALRRGQMVRHGMLANSVRTRACSAGVKRPVDKCLGLACDGLATRSRSRVKIDQIGGGFSCVA
jgi:hypothetical protein